MKYSVDADRIDLMDERWYKVPMNDGTYEYYPSVNEVLSIINKGSQYDEWLKNNGHNSEILMDRAGKLGTAVHNLIENFLKGNEIEYFMIEGDERFKYSVWHRFMIWLTWWKTVEIKYSEDYIETIVYDSELKYAGTCDLLCKLKDEYAVLDWKTGNTVGDKEDMQLVAYARALEKKLNIKIPKCYIMWMPSKTPNKNGYRLIEIENSDAIFDNFTSALKLWKYKNTSKPRFLQFPTKVNIRDIDKTEVIINVAEKSI